MTDLVSILREHRLRRRDHVLMVNTRVRILDTGKIGVIKSIDSDNILLVGFDYGDRFMARENVEPYP